MEIVLLDKNSSKDWNNFARRSDDAWFWHTTYWMDFTEEIFTERFCSNTSFSIVEKSEILAICPVIIERSNLADSTNQFSCTDGPIPFPAMRNDLSHQHRQRLLKFYIQTLESLAQKENVGFVSVRVPAIARHYLSWVMPFAIPLLKYGFVDLPFHTQVIDLKKDLTFLWADMRKGHKADIKRAEQVCEAKVWDQYTVTAEKFREYQLLHRKDAGRVTRSQRTFDLMLSWIRQGNAILVEAKHSDQAIGFSLIMLYGSGAYYGSSCKDPDNFNIPASHLIQWATIHWLKEHHFEWYDIGIQQFYPQWFDPASSKDISISFFKRGFGGVTIPLVTGEFFYSKALQEQIYTKRWQQYLSTLSAA